MNIDISAVICTHNRASYLGKSMQSLSVQILDSNQYEIIIVDNSSTDYTPQLCEPFLNRPNWKYFYEPVPNLSRARNIGWRNARGRYISFMDDDAIADPNWLERLLKAFEESNPKVGCIGGRCLPIWESPRPDWLSDNMLSAFSIFHYADTRIILNRDQILTGCNFAFPRAVLEQVGGFRENLGRSGSNLLSNEDIDIRNRLDSLGFDSMYDPEIIVHHHILESRLTKKWFYRRAYWQGVSSAKMRYSVMPLGVIPKARLILKKIGEGLVRAGVMIFSMNGENNFKRRLQIVERLGFISAIMGIRS